MRKRKKGAAFLAQFKDYILLVIYAGDLEVIYLLTTVRWGKAYWIVRGNY